MYSFEFTNEFKKDYKRTVKRNLKIELLQNSGELPAKFKAHKLSGNYSDCWECHIQNDWLLIWQINTVEKIIILLRTGTHSDLF